MSIFNRQSDQDVNDDNNNTNVQQQQSTTTNTQKIDEIASASKAQPVVKTAEIYEKEATEKDERIANLENYVQQLDGTVKAMTKKLHLPEQKSILEVIKLFLETALLTNELSKITEVAPLVRARLVLNNDLMPTGLDVISLADELKQVNKAK